MRAEKRIFGAIDNSRSIREIAALTLPSVKDTRQMATAQSFFERLWYYDQVVFDASGRDPHKHRYLLPRRKCIFFSLMSLDKETQHTPSTDPPTPDMIWIPGGTFGMGSEDFYQEERPVHEVTVDGFWMDPTKLQTSSFRALLRKPAM